MIRKRAFTLIEMLIIVAIIGILAGIAMVTYLNQQVSSRDARRKADLNTIAIALDQYRSDLANEEHGSYPKITINKTEELKNENETNKYRYFSSINNDPLAPDRNYYYSASIFVNPNTILGKDYKLYAQLEDDSDAMTGDGGQCSNQFEVTSNSSAIFNPTAFTGFACN